MENRSTLSSVAPHHTAGDFDQQERSSNAMWTRMERSWMADAALAPGSEPSQVTAVRLRHTPSGDPMLGGAISFSNSITIEENTLGPGVVGHLLHARTISPVTFAAVDRWLGKGMNRKRRRSNRV